MCAPGQPTKSQCLSHKLASLRITEGCGYTEARYGAASGCSCASYDRREGIRGTEESCPEQPCWTECWYVRAIVAHRNQAQACLKVSRSLIKYGMACHGWVVSRESVMYDRSPGTDHNDSWVLEVINPTYGIGNNPPAQAVQAWSEEKRWGRRPFVI